MSGCQGTMNRLANRTLSSIRKCTWKNIPGKKGCAISGTFLTEQRFMKLTSALEQELDEAVLNRLISKILVGDVQKIDGQKFQQGKIIYTFLATSIKFPLAYR